MKSIKGLLLTVLNKYNWTFIIVWSVIFFIGYHLWKWILTSIF